MPGGSSHTEPEERLAPSSAPPRHLRPNAVAYNAALGACGRASSAESALQLLKRMDQLQAGFSQRSPGTSIEFHGILLVEEARLGGKLPWKTASIALWKQNLHILALWQDLLILFNTVFLLPMRAPGSLASNPTYPTVPRPWQLCLEQFHLRPCAVCSTGDPRRSSGPSAPTEPPSVHAGAGTSGKAH